MWQVCSLSECKLILRPDNIPGMNFTLLNAFSINFRCSKLGTLPFTWLFIYLKLATIIIYTVSIFYFFSLIFCIYKVVTTLCCYENIKIIFIIQENADPWIPSGWQNCTIFSARHIYHHGIHFSVVGLTASFMQSLSTSFTIQPCVIHA